MIRYLRFRSLWRLLLPVIALFISLAANAQKSNPYGLKIMDESSYKTAVKANSDQELVEIKKWIPNVSWLIETKLSGL